MPATSEASESRSPAARATSRGDHAARRRAVRKGREKGCSVYIKAEDLEAMGFDPSGPPPFFRTWAGPRGRLVVQLYREG